jgi:hypothetical protein
VSEAARNVTASKAPKAKLGPYEEICMASFSERMGFTGRKDIQIDDMDMDLRNSLWNVCRRFFFIADRTSLRDSSLERIAIIVFEYFLKVPVDDAPLLSSQFVTMMREYFQRAEWWSLLNLLELLTDYSGNSERKHRFTEQINIVMERENSGYRFVAGQIAPITNQLEIGEVELAAERCDKFASVSEHVRRALAMYSDRQAPDYRNSIKESISAVESAAKILIGNRAATLGDAIKAIDRVHSIHPAFRDGILKLYGYTNDKGGIRHALTEAVTIDEPDARFMLISCSALANYLISRYDQAQPEELS